MSKANPWILQLVLGLVMPLYRYASPASATPLKENWSVYPSSIELKVGEQQQISVITRRPMVYTAVFGWDNPAIGTLTAHGLMTAHSPGQGLITISAGNHRQHIFVKVIE